MAINLVLTDNEASYLSDILELWIGGHEEATTMVKEDRSFDTADEYLVAVEGMTEQYNGALLIKMRLDIAKGERAPTG